MDVRRERIGSPAARPNLGASSQGTETSQAAARPLRLTGWRWRAQQPDPGRPLDETQPQLVVAPRALKRQCPPSEAGRAAAEVAEIEADGAVVTPFDDGGLSDDVVNALWDAATERSPEAFW